MATEKPRYSITLDVDLFKRLENFRYAKRFPTRNQATVELIRLGLEAVEKQENNPPPTEQDEESETMQRAKNNGGNFKL